MTPAPAFRPHRRSRLRSTLQANGLAAALLVALAAPVALGGCASGRAPPASTDDAGRLVQAMQGRSIVVLGEVHDNPVQHALRHEALRRLVAGGTRPALAFEQFDRERQADIDRARRERPRDPDHLIAQATRPGDAWDWSLYRPYVALALEHELPILAANLSRADAARVVRQGFGAVFDAEARRARGLDALPPDFWRAHERAVDVGHCGVLPASMHAPMARAQIARDVVLADTLLAWRDGPVVLLTGNGHARSDIGVPYWLGEDARRGTISIAVLERGGAADAARAFDATFFTAATDRPDPCAGLADRLARPPRRP